MRADDAADRVTPLRLVVLAKAVPDPALASERLGEELHIVRSAEDMVLNGNDEYALEAAVTLSERYGASVTVIMMGPPFGERTLRRALAMGAHRGVLVTDDALRGACTLMTTRVLNATLRAIGYDLVLAGIDTSDSASGVVPAGVAALLRVPLLGSAATIELDPDIRWISVRRTTAFGTELLATDLPAVVTCTQAVGSPRAPSVRAVMAARSKEVATLSLEELGWGPGMLHPPTTRVIEARAPKRREPARFVSGPPDEAAAELFAFLRERNLV